MSRMPLVILFVGAVACSCAGRETSVKTTSSAPAHGEDDDWIRDLFRQGAYVADEPEKTTGMMAPRAQYLEDKFSRDLVTLSEVFRAGFQSDTRLITLGHCFAWRGMHSSSNTRIKQPYRSVCF